MVRNFSEIGENLQRIVRRLMSNDDLCKLLYYTDKDPLSQPNLTQDQKEEIIFNNLIRILPVIKPTDSVHSMIAILCEKSTISPNPEFHNLVVTVQTFVPITQWFIKNTNLRPYLILGEIKKSLDDKTINGLGKMVGGDFEVNLVTDEMTGFIQDFVITSYD